MMDNQFPRRAFLQGLGTALALPAMESLVPKSASAAAKAGDKPPVRMAFIYVPNGKDMAHWSPKDLGENFQLPPILEPLQPVKSDILVMSGLTHDKARANGDGPGDHARSTGAFLTAVQPYKTNGADIRLGISVDQVVAQANGKLTRFPSLEIGVDRGRQSGNCDSGYSCAYSSNISWRGPTQPVAKEINPRAVFERLFSNGKKAEVSESQAKRNRYRKSILDMVTEDAATLKKRLSGKDLQKLDEYFTSVREIEQRLLSVELGGAAAIPGATKPAGIPRDWSEHVRLMGDMMVLAFQADLTRVCSFMYANAGSNRSFRNIDVPEGHHNLSHHQNNPEKIEKIRRINRYYVEQFSRLLQKMKSIKEADGSTLLDNSMIVYGSAISDGNRHNHEELPVLLAGKGGGAITTGRHVRYPRNTPMGNLFLSMMDQVGVVEERFGDSTGRLNQLT